MTRLFILIYSTALAIFFIAVIAMDQFELFSTDSLDATSLANEITATRKLVDKIGETQGAQAAEQALQGFAKDIHLALTRYEVADDTLSEAIKQGVKDYGLYIEDVDENQAYFSLASDPEVVYGIINDPDSPFINTINRKEWFVFVELCAALALISIMVLFVISRRLARLEKTCIAFAYGDFSARASTSSLHSVGQLNLSFNIMADRISQLIQSHKNLTNAIAHESRTPIFRIQCNLDMLDDSGVRPEQMQYLEGIQEDLNELGGMIEELLQFAKLERPDAQLSLTPTNLYPLLASQLEHLQFETQKRLQLEGDDSLMAPIASHLLLRATSNIIRNGYKYAQSCVIVTLCSDETSVLIEIANDGPPIPQDYWQSIFEPFVRLDKARDRQSGGHGLGLAIAKQIVRQHQGELTLGDSELGGPCFTLRLPKAE
ncbi:ATP-binding protein [Shewanella insulae]|uniref:ATP-binding protein n=1 Tax=Shewanella insulae TaxID=2681496 RepID=UPI002480D789|nr:ATP-binding protein [Shewanella insulae]